MKIKQHIARARVFFFNSASKKPKSIHKCVVYKTRTVPRKDGCPGDQFVSSEIVVMYKSKLLTHRREIELHYLRVGKK